MAKIANFVLCVILPIKKIHKGRRGDQANDKGG